MIANVHGGGHFVLAYGVAGDGTNILVKDPAFNVDRYAIGDIVGWREYTIS